MSTTVYVVRHAEVNNPKNIDYVRLPGFGLSEWGKKQAKELATVFSNEDIAAIYSSPLKRTKETARLCSNGRLRVKYCDDFLEANYKKWQGLVKSEKNPKEVEDYRNHPVKYSAILGESLVDVQRRVVGKLNELIEKHQNQKIIVVTHAAPAIVARIHFENKSLNDYQKYTVNFASVTIITFDDDLKCMGVVYKEFAKQREANEQRQMA